MRCSSTGAGKGAWVRAVRYVNVAVSVGLLGVLLYKVDWERIRLHVGATDLATIFIVLLILVLQFPISAYKWKISLDIFKLRFRFRFLHKILCMGFFISSFLPTNIGGDGYRALRTMPSNDMKSLGLSAVLLERIVGFAILVGLGLAGAVGTFTDYAFRAAYMSLSAGVLFGIFVALLLFLVIVRQLLHWEDTSGPLRDIMLRIQKINLIHQNLQYLRSGGKQLLHLAQVSTVFQVLSVLSIYLLFRSIGVDTGMAECAFIAAFAGIASVVPLSINGIGIVEGFFVFSSRQVGITYHEAVIVAFMLRMLTTILTLACGIVYLYDSGKKPATEPRAS